MADAYPEHEGGDEQRPVDWPVFPRGADAPSDEVAPGIQSPGHDRSQDQHQRPEALARAEHRLEHSLIYLFILALGQEQPLVVFARFIRLEGLTVLSVRHSSRLL